MRSVGFSDVIEMWTDISKKYKELYGKRLNVRFETRHNDDFTNMDVSFLGKVHCTIVHGYQKYCDKDSILFDDFVWKTHELVHEFGHANQRLDKFMDVNANEDTMDMAKQQVICRNFPHYAETSYSRQMIEIDAERYAWIETVSALSQYFDESDVKEALVNGVRKNYNQIWFADKNISSWEDGLRNLDEALSDASNMTWEVSSNYEDMVPGLYENFGKNRNELLFKYCVLNNGFEQRKFTCLKSCADDIRKERRLHRDLPSYSQSHDDENYEHDDEDDRSL